MKNEKEGKQIFMTCLTQLPGGRWPLTMHGTPWPLHYLRYLRRLTLALLVTLTIPDSCRYLLQCVVWSIANVFDNFASHRGVHIANLHRLLWVSSKCKWQMQMIYCVWSIANDLLRWPCVRQLCLSPSGVHIENLHQRQWVSNAVPGKDICG